MTDQIKQNDGKLKPVSKVPVILAGFSVTAIVLLAIAYILILCQGSTGQSASVSIASAVFTGLALWCLLVTVACGFRINHTADGPYDEQIFKFALAAAVLGTLALIFIAILTSGYVTNHTGISNIIKHVNIFVSFYTLFVAAAVVFATLASIVTIKHSYKFSIKVSKTDDTLVK